MLVVIQKLETDGASIDNLLKVMITSLQMKDGLTDAQIEEKLLCFGANGICVF